MLASDRPIESFYVLLLRLDPSQLRYESFHFDQLSNMNEQPWHDVLFKREDTISVKVRYN